MAEAYFKEQDMLHRKQSWFFGHLIGAVCMVKDSHRLERIIKDLNRPIQDCGETFVIKCKQDAIEYEKRFGIRVLPDA